MYGYFSRKIRQDIELATDEMVLDKLKNEEKKEYGMTLINSLKIYQEEKYTAKLLCVTDDSKIWKESKNGKIIRKI